MTKPIIFSTPMVKAILDGDKTMTRRVIKPQPKCRLSCICAGAFHLVGKWTYPSQYAFEQDGISPPPEGLAVAERNAFWTPPCYPDDVLWVRETWQYLPDSVALDGGGFVYKASDNGDAWATTEEWTWRPSIFMPKEAARIFLRVTVMRVERLQEISGADIAREGVGSGAIFDTLTDRAAFRKLWDGLRKPADRDKYGWDANPWVWVISFERCEKPK